ncbi:hypothetical protein PF005_g3400 [Phytophthora fragariae]|uniref:F-box domain-containing protein n=1 Tax=Phytophthora fragariae TaxID=53985 RepID=A0A6A3Z8Z1_9STRA|nr:hypothetical protein PF003_g19589 [Phytophthora fragariae]KAE8946765.1 hypothetical protein PF009_g3645 [Phytophthora fragariae]KAE9012424.1 hypothetical protein PF011_g8924 [Phytophthora fragariae]KAE9115128.1 hypothetical protein PF010_g9445 [Phytophthora fragariae]KAE9133568.1 hypothetical protein PF007_g3318 [Phytophthora fragariae]
MVSTPSDAAAFATPPAWHDPTDVQVRKLMMARLRNHPVLALHHPLLQAREDTGASPSLLQRLEWMLYHSAGSLSEYLHQPSLERRVQGLVTHYKRKRADTDPSEEVMAAIRATAAKRQRARPQLSISEDEVRRCSVGARGCVLNSNLDLLHQVCSFLDGADVLRCRGVNKFLYLHAPSLVRTLHVDAVRASVTETRNRGDGAASGLCTLLHECTNLTSLTISNRANQTHLKAGVVFPRALTAATYMASLATTSYGHQLVRQVADALDEGACSSLERLELLAPFDFAAESDGVLLALRALAEPKRCQRARKPLKHLVLDATFLGDRGVEQLAGLLDSQGAFFQHLQTLTVRNNFMGETGCRALLEAIESFDELQVLDLSRNILTDTDALALADLLDDPVADMNFCDSADGDWKEDERVPEHLDVLGLAGLRTLKLQENFITCDGFHAITIALCARQGFVATVGNATDNNEGEEEEEEEVEEEEDEVELMEAEQQL